MDLTMSKVKEVNSFSVQYGAVIFHTSEFPMLPTMQHTTALTLAVCYTPCSESSSYAKLHARP